MSGYEIISKFLRHISGAGAMAILATAALAFNANAQAAIATSTFDTDADGWVGLLCTNPGVCDGTLLPADKFIFSPDGYIKTIDPGSSAAARLGAPAKFFDNLFIGATLSFDILVIDPDGGGVFDVDPPPVVTIEGAGITLAYLGVKPTISAWTHYDVPLEVTGDSGPDNIWLKFLTGDPQDYALATMGDFNTVFGSLTRLSITGEFINDDSDSDSVSLDNVNLVPVPAALPLLLSALAGLGLGVWRRRVG